ncbi:MAG: hypothetical protein ABIO70_07405 [Pseudomonadota bacterium]
MCTSLRCLSTALAPALALLCWGWSAPARAEDLSVKVENYIFAASEALADGEPALALSLLRRAKSEAPESCIVDEYLCRTYTAIGNAKMARESYQRFAGCMEVTDEGVLSELDALVAGLEAAPREPAPPAPTAPTPAPAPQITVNTPPPTVVVAPAPSRGYPGRGAGWALFGTGLAAVAGGGVGMGLTWNWGEHYVERHNQEKYEELIPWNHASVIGLGVGGALALAGVGLEIGLARHGQKSVALAPTVHGLALEVRR